MPAAALKQRPQALDVNSELDQLADLRDRYLDLQRKKDQLAEQGADLEEDYSKLTSRGWEVVDRSGVTDEELDQMPSELNPDDWE
ncbi:hypothetical protein [Rhodomicrobium lacus]|uniref:hypothetical protein n=1 Tax=Rhodomicrobium lacus TaxID=2498452 RepID=UPI000F8D1398|nr:hypothetical protein [Rhodomicrobium lacus]